MQQKHRPSSLRTNPKWPNLEGEKQRRGCRRWRFTHSRPPRVHPRTLGHRRAWCRSESAPVRANEDPKKAVNTRPAKLGGTSYDDPKSVHENDRWEEGESPTSHPPRSRQHEHRARISAADPEMTCCNTHGGALPISVSLLTLKVVDYS